MIDVIFSVRAKFIFILTFILLLSGCSAEDSIFNSMVAKIVGPISVNDAQMQEQANKVVSPSLEGLWMFYEDGYESVTYTITDNSPITEDFLRERKQDPHSSRMTFAIKQNPLDGSYAVIFDLEKYQKDIAAGAELDFSEYEDSFTLEADTLTFPPTLMPGGFLVPAVTATVTTNNLISFDSTVVESITSNTYTQNLTELGENSEDYGLAPGEELEVSEKFEQKFTGSRNAVKISNDIKPIGRIQHGDTLEDIYSFRMTKGESNGYFKFKARTNSGYISMKEIDEGGPSYMKIKRDGDRNVYSNISPDKLTEAIEGNPQLNLVMSLLDFQPLGQGGLLDVQLINVSIDTYQIDFTTKEDMTDETEVPTAGKIMILLIP